jgi:uncharacterized membrane protein YphA (DoxX/SURF4 family)
MYSKQTSGTNPLVLLALLVFSIALGVLNNLVNPNSVGWLGSPRVFPKPLDWPTLSAAEGVAAGLRFAWTEMMRHSLWVAGALLVLALGAAAFRQRASGPSGSSRWVMSCLRVFFGLMFLAAAWPKFTDPDGFALMVAQYQMLPAFAVNAFSVWLPAVEITAGLAILLLPWEREATTFLLVLMGMFIVALAQALARDLGIACGCFDIKGATDAGETWFALLRDIVLLLPLGWMWRRAQCRPLWRF